MDCGTAQEGLSYEGNIIRPPSEAFSTILQVTVGCSHNKCTFCPTYSGVLFRIKDEPGILGQTLIESALSGRAELKLEWMRAL